MKKVSYVCDEGEIMIIILRFATNVRYHSFDHVCVIDFNFVVELVFRLVYIKTGEKGNDDKPQLSSVEMNA